MSLNRYGGGSTSAPADLNDHINDAVDAHDASAISVVPTGNLAADDVQEALTELQNDINTRATIDDPTFTTRITSPAIRDSGATASRAAYFDSNKDLQSSSTTSTELGYVNGVTSAIQTQIDAKESITNVKAIAGDYAASIGFRNRIINGDMRIDQRNGGAAVSVAVATKTFAVDRWFGYGQAADGVFSLQQLTTGTPPNNFTHYLRAKTTPTADASIGAAQLYFMGHTIEGYNVADLGWGTSAAKTVTLSFWVRSSLTGTFGGSLGNNSNRCYVFSFTINAANTWEQKTITIAGDTTGTYNVDNTAGVMLIIDLGCGSTSKGTAGAWSGTYYYGVTGGTNLIGTLNATLDLTGVQLEVGATATPFERRPYHQELFLCMRYYEQSDYWIWSGNTTNGNAYYSWQHFAVPKRASTVTVTKRSESNSGFSNNATTNAVSSTYGFRVSCTATSSATPGLIVFTNGWTADSEI